MTPMTDPATLAMLQDIRLTLIVMCCAVVLGVAAIVVRFFFLVRTMIHTDINPTLDKLFRSKADELFDKGRFEELVRHCSEELRDRPNYVYALWHLGRAQFALKAYDRARVPFQRIVELEPSWDEGHVRPYLKRIDDQSRLH